MSPSKPGIQEVVIHNFLGPDPVSAWTLTGQGGLSITVLTFGGIVQKIFVPDQNGNYVDVALGFDNPLDYLGPHPFFGATAGRIAGRVTKGKLEIGGELFQLPINDPPNHLHGGIDSIDKKIWIAAPVTRDNSAPSLELSISSKDGENGYPGQVDLSVTYTITHDNRFIFETRATSNRPTPVSLTHHSYFNLTGESSGSTDAHEIKILSSQAFEADQSMGLTGKLLRVEGQPNDARTGQRIADFRKKIWKEHGDLYWLEKERPLSPVVWLRDPATGRTLEVATDCPCLQFYSGIGLDGSLIGKSGSSYGPGAGVCLECEGYPNAFGDEERFGSILVEPGTPQRTRTEYRFSHQTESLIPS